MASEKSLAEYYDIAWQEGVRSLFDIIARSKAGIVTADFDQAQDTYANLRKNPTTNSASPSRRRSS